MADWLSGLVRVEDIVGRAGSDEFVMLLPETSEDDAGRVGKARAETIDELAGEGSGETVHDHVDRIGGGDFGAGRAEVPLDGQEEDGECLGDAAAGGVHGEGERDQGSEEERAGNGGRGPRGGLAVGGIVISRRHVGVMLPGAAGRRRSTGP